MRRVQLLEYTRRNGVRETARRLGRDKAWISRVSRSGRTIYVVTDEGGRLSLMEGERAL